MGSDRSDSQEWYGQRMTRRALLRRAALGGLAFAGAFGAPPALMAAPAVVTPKSGGILKLRTTADAAHLDLQRVADITGLRTVSLVYSKLLRFKHGPGVGYQDLVIEPELAERWQVSPDRTTYTFHLRTGVKFQDIPPVNGRELTAEDVKFSFERVMRVVPPVHTYAFEQVDHYEIPDKYTIKIVLKQPFNGFLDYVADTYTGIIVPREVEEKHGDYKTVAIGSGPFYLEDYTRGVAVKVRKNKTYWKKGLPYLDGVDIMIVPDDSAALAAMRAGQLDILHLGSQMAQALRKTNPELTFDKFTEAYDPIFMVNINQAPWTDKRLRQAFSLALDRKDILASVLRSDGVVNTHVAGAFKEYIVPWTGLPNLKHEPEKAKKLLAEAGFPGGVPVKILATSGYSEPYMSVGEACLSQLRKAGFKAEFDIRAYAEFMSLNAQVKYEVLMVTKSRPNADWYMAYYLSNSRFNRVKYSNPRFDDAMHRWRTALAGDDRKKAMAEMQVILDDDMPAVPSVWQHSYSAHPAYVKNFRQSFRGLWCGADVFDDVWLDKASNA